MKNTITIKPARPIIAADQIQEHFDNPDNVRWVALHQLMEDTAEHCVDGRSKEGIIGTPGGNMGEFILALDSAEKITDVWIRPNEVARAFADYLEHFGSFYMHTDTHALKHLHETLKKNQTFAAHAAKLKNIKEIEAFVRKPPIALQPALLELLLDPAHIGCGHLKLMLAKKSEFGVRSALIQTALTAFFQKLWSGAKLDYVVLDEDHREGAVVVVLVEDKTITEKTLIPTVASMGKTAQMFISHPQAEAFMREQIVKDIIEHELIYGIDESNQKAFLAMVQSRGADFTRYTLSHLALGLPHYTVSLKQN